MFRKTVLAVAATATLGIAALAPSTASAAHAEWHVSADPRLSDNYSIHDDRSYRTSRSYRRSHGPGFSFRFSNPRYAYAPRCYTVRRWVDTRRGLRMRTVRICR
jgi:hypothetical protein